MCIGGGYHLFPFFYLTLTALKVFSKFAGACVCVYVSGKFGSSQALILQTL